MAGDGAAEPEVVLRLGRITKRFGPLTANDQISFDVRRSEVARRQRDAEVSHRPISRRDDLVRVLVQRELQPVEPHVDPVVAHTPHLAAEHVDVEGAARREIAHRDRHVEDRRHARHERRVRRTAGDPSRIY